MNKLPFDLRNDKIPDDYWINVGAGVDINTVYPRYKGVAYVYCKYQNTWILFENFWYGWTRYFNADKYRIDQCFDIYFKNDFA